MNVYQGNVNENMSYKLELALDFQILGVYKTKSAYGVPPCLDVYCLFSVNKLGVPILIVVKKIVYSIMYACIYITKPFSLKQKVKPVTTTIQKLISFSSE